MSTVDQVGERDGRDPGLQLIAAGITELLGFGAATINLVRGDELVVVASSGAITGSIDGRDGVRAEELVGARWPVAALQRLLEHAEVWGHFRYAARYFADNTDQTPWIASAGRADQPEAWHADDALVAPIHDDEGILRGCIAVDEPVDGRRPGPARRRILEQFAERTRRAVLLTVEHERLVRRARNHRLAQELLRNATARLSLEDVIDAVAESLLDALDADGLRLHARGPDGEVVAFGSEGLVWTPPESAILDARGAARTSWERDTFMITDRAGLAEHPDLAQYRATILDVLDRVAADHMLYLPLGFEDEAFGQLVLFRGPGRPPWTAREGRLAMELGRDLGQVVLRSNAYSRERDLADRLRAADEEHSRLIEALVRELDRPLADLDDGVADVRRAPRDSPEWRSGVAAVTASSEHMVGLVDELLLLSRLSEQPTPADRFEPVDVSGVLAAARDAAASLAEARGVALALEAPTDPAYVLGDRQELATAIRHLVTNGLTYTPAGGRVTLRLDTRPGEAVVSVADTGIGIPSAEQATVVAEFVRGSDPAVRETPGAGLGLAIVRRVAARHGARLELDSTPGMGTTVRLTFPAE